jgi:hypothetical protein
MKNIWEIINNFNTVFGETPISVKADFVSGVHLFIKMLYDENVNIEANGIENDWNQYSHCGNNCGIVRIWATRNKKTSEPELILFYDSIYINRHIMPDREKAKRFCEACEEFAGGYANLKIRSEHVVLSDRLLNAFIAETEKNIEHNKKLIATEKNLDRTQEYARDIADSVDTLKILKEIHKSQTKKS